MLTLLSPRTVGTHQIHVERKVSPHSGHCYYVTSCLFSSHGSWGHQNGYLMHNIHESWSRRSSSGPCISNLGASKRLLHLNVYASSSDEYRSSRNIAVNLYKKYRDFVDRGGADNLKEFISVGVNAYSLGCTDEGLRKELLSMKESGADIEFEQTYGGKTGLKYKIYAEEVRECILWLSIVFITILCTPQPTVVRWSSTTPISDEIKLQWKGFCALIANAYYVKGMAWLPVKTLQLEQMVVMGRAEEPSIVSSRMRLVFTTLEIVSPQWPKV